MSECKEQEGRTGEDEGAARHGPTGTKDAPRRRGHAHGSHRTCCLVTWVCSRARPGAGL